ncbi:DUF6448 family protein [Falsiroseomonas oryziterrae]|uniref:DUF6448 family protein n=1 Tax=Falsiroseomonas oryziterrae TaxID=2911368 RepID=UPI001F3B641D|nr:DUF6448 family protein [Roseomonas sp. NPKOSM-4]
MQTSRKLLLGSILAGALVLSLPAAAHCDGEDGPVAGAALRALEAGNVALALPYAPAAAEVEITRAFEQARAVRALGAEARALADRHFMETVVRLHRAGENAPYTGLQPKGTDYGPAIPAAERALETGQAEALVELLTREVRHQVEERLERARAVPGSAEPRSAAEVQAARERVSAAFAFIGYVEGIHAALAGGVHQAATTAHHD